MQLIESKEGHLSVSLLQLLHCDGEDGVGATGVLVHQGCPHTPVLLAHLHCIPSMAFELHGMHADGITFCAVQMSVTHQAAVWCISLQTVQCLLSLLLLCAAWRSSAQLNERHYMPRISNQL